MIETPEQIIAQVERLIQSNQDAIKRAQAICDKQKDETLQRIARFEKVIERERARIAARPKPAEKVPVKPAVKPAKKGK